jgi:hypothetical protein
MTPRSFIALAVVTVAMVGAAVAAVVTRPTPTLIPADRALVFPEVAPAVNAVAELEVKSADRSFTVKAKDSGWVLASVGDYPVLFDKVKTVLVQISQLKLLEAKTANADRYDRLDVQPVSAKGAKSREITLRDKDGKVLAKGLIGKKVDTLFGADRGGTYVRVDGEKRAWLAEGTVDLGAGPADWVSRKVVDVSGDNMKRLTVTAPGGGTVMVQRAAPGDKDFKLSDVPEGKTQRGQWETNQMPKALEGIELKDLATAADVEFKDGGYKAEFETFDGLVIRTEAAKVGNRYWARFSASAENATGDKAEELKKKAEEINARTKGYVYEIDEAPGKKLTCDHVNLLEGAGTNACA